MSATSGPDAALVADALRRGLRDENLLTDLLFFARHPERRGVKLGPGDTALVREWLGIRDGVVRPVLRALAPTRSRRPTTPNGQRGVGRPRAPAAGPTPGAEAGPECVGDGSCMQCGTCRACERRIRAAPAPNLEPVPTVLAAHPDPSLALDSEALEAYRQLLLEARTSGIAEPYLQITSGHRDYDRQANRLWRPRLLAMLAEFGCAPPTLQCAGVAADAASRTLRAVPPPHPAGSWETRFREELRKIGCVVQCDPERVEAVARRKNVSLSDPADTVGSAVRILRAGTAPPGASPHHTGLAVDVFVGRAPGASSSASTDAEHVRWQRQQPPYRWLVCNAARFGFFPYNREPWHWEYNPARLA